MKPVVFTGPTISAEDAARELDAVFLAPVSQGDVYRVATLRPPAIGIIDGYFEHVPSVWHKEVLWAMKSGVHVFGSASMGALRAAELAAFGMVGVGWIFERFHEGSLTDDDEVAVAHASADDGWRAQSDAMVNIRQTVAAAERDGVISGETASGLVQRAKARFYPERVWPALIAEAVDFGAPAAEVAALRSWLPAGHVNQKRADAEAMLRTMARLLDANPAPKAVDFSFEHTVYWDHLARHAGVVEIDAEDDRSSATLDEVLDELRLDRSRFAIAHEGAVLRHLALSEAERASLHPSAEGVGDSVHEFRSVRGLTDAAAVDRWMAENAIDETAAGALIVEEARIQMVRNSVAPEAVQHLPNHLRVRGEFGPLLARAKAKRQALAEQGLANAGLDDLGLAESDLFEWYFDGPAPDVTQYALSSGFEDIHAFRRAVLREYCYQRVCAVHG